MCRGWLWKVREGDRWHISVTPRARLDRDGHWALGLQWLGAWLYVNWGSRRRVWERSQIELLPHVWAYSNRVQAGIHLDWIFWRWHVRLCRFSP